MKDKDLLGKTIVSMGDGARVGTVKDLIFRAMYLDALLVAGERGEGLLPFKSLAAIGPDAITIESYTLVDWNPGSALGPESKDLSQLRKLSVVDAEGNKLGHVHDITMDATGQVVELDVRTDGLFGIGAHGTTVPASKVRAFGSDLITVEVSG